MVQKQQWNNSSILFLFSNCLSSSGSWGGLDALPALIRSKCKQCGFFQHRKIDAAICVATKWTKNKTKKSKRCRESWRAVSFGVLAWKWKSLLRALETENHYQTALLVGTFFFYFLLEIFLLRYTYSLQKKNGNINTGCIEGRAELLIGKES